MNQVVTLGIVLRRVDYQEADRILTVLTPDHGKVALIAKGARRAKSKLAGGIELFSVSDISFIQGRKDIGTLTSSRLKRHFAHITSDLDRTMLAYDFLKRIDRLVEDDGSEGYFEILAESLAGLDVAGNPALVEAWFYMQLLGHSGHAPELRYDVHDQPLSAEALYNFDYDAMRFVLHERGRFTPTHIKLLRLLLGQVGSQKLSKITAEEKIIDSCRAMAKQMFEHNLH